jgi:hypothetical protein
MGVTYDRIKRMPTLALRKKVEVGKKNVSQVKTPVLQKKGTKPRNPHT